MEVTTNLSLNAAFVMDGLYFWFLCGHIVVVNTWWMMVELLFSLTFLVIQD